LQQHGDKFWEAEHIGKWLDAACTMCKYTGDPRIRELMDEAVSGMIAAQAPNGWLGSYDEPYRYYQLNWNGLFKPTTWDTYYGWDLWCNFTSLEGLLKYHWATTNEIRALRAAQRIGDLVIETFGDGKQDISLVAHDNGAGAMTLLLGFAHLYEASGERRYLEFCRYLRSMYVPDDETCFVLYEAESAESARRAAALAAIAFEQVSEVIGDGGNTDAYILTADKREGSMSDGSAQRTDDDRPGASGRCRD